MSKLIQTIKETAGKVSGFAKRTAIAATAVAALAIPAAAQQYSLNIEASALGSGTSSQVMRDLNFVTDSRLVFTSTDEQGRALTIYTENNTNFEDGDDFLAASYAFDIKDVRVIPFIRFDDKGLKEFDLIAAKRIGDAELSVLFVQDNNNFTLVRPRYDGAVIDAAVGQRWDNGVSDQDYILGAHTRDGRLGAWFGLKADDALFNVITVDCKGLGAIGYGKRNDDGSGFYGVQFAAGADKRLGGTYSHHTGWTGSLIFGGTPAPFMGSFPSYLNGAFAGAPVAGQIAYNDNGSHYLAVQAGTKLGQFKLAGKDVHVAAGGGMNVDFDTDDIKPVAETVMTMDLDGSSKISLELRGSSDDVSATVFTNYKF